MLSDEYHKHECSINLGPLREWNDKAMAAMLVYQAEEANKKYLVNGTPT
jgi:hypothetical protein